MMRRVALLIFVVFAILSGSRADAAEAETNTVKLQLVSGSTIEGTPISFLDSGLVVRRPDGILADRVPWTNFTQSALITLNRNFKQAEVFVGHMIERDEEEDPIPRDAKVTLKSVTRLERPDPKAGLGVVFSTPLSLAVCVLIYLANLYAGYEVARYRNYHPVMVCAIAAVAPIVGPVLFLCLPTYFEEVIEEEEVPETQEPMPFQQHAAAAKDAAEEAAAAAAAPAAGGPAGPVIYKRPQTTFNRRFFETKLAPFMKVVPSEAERDLVICVSATRGNFVGTRVARVHATGLGLLVKKGDASTEVEIPFSEVTEVQIRHKDAGG
jgi:hypothetical protein